ncbi:MAG TPA: hypothetical protein DCL21_01460, partial [Alphaproteobacteria bacterium]|nr:hypothetical protein [Alphaproteobacteria bacterium]
MAILNIYNLTLKHQIETTQSTVAKAMHSHAELKLCMLPKLVILNGEFILSDEWLRPLNKGDILEVRFLPQGGGGGSTRTIAMIAVAVLAGAAAAAAVAATG